MAPLVDLTFTDSVAVATVNRPPANALNQELMDELADTAIRLTEDPPRVVLLRSAVPGIFIAGADLLMTDAGWNAVPGTVERFQRTVNLWEAVPAPTVAVIGGHALGGGLELALACDFRLMASGGATIGLPEVRWSLLASGGGTQRIARLVGQGHALNLVMRGLRIDATEAERIGLVTQSFELEELDHAASLLAEELAALPAFAVAACKRAVRRGLTMDLASGLALEREEMASLALTADAREGVRAFVEHRQPRFEGH